MRKKENIICGIYCIENLLNHKKYVGQAISIYDRWSKHKSSLKNNKHENGHLQNAWNKYGEENFNFYVLEECSAELLDEREIFYINSLNLLDDSYGYNDKEGGQSGKVSEEANERRKQSLRKYYEVNPEAKKQSSINALKQWSDPNIKAKIMGENNGMYGKTHTKEAREKISQAQKGRISPFRNTTPVLCVELNKIFECAAIAMKQLNITSSSILQACYGNRKTAGGYHWQFVTENNI